MQDTTYNHGITIREFYNESKAAEKYKKAASDPRTKQIRQVLRIGRNDPCPCGSGLKFKKCCIDKVGKGPELIKRTASDDHRTTA